MSRFSPLALLLAAGLLAAGCSQPSFTDALERAEKAFEQNNLVGAIDALTLGMRHWSDADGDEAKARAYEILGQSYQRLRNTDKAIEAYREAIQLSDDTYDCAYALGTLYLAKSQPDLARDAFLTALRMRPEDPLATLGLANSHYARKNLAEALEAYEDVLNRSPGVRDALEGISIVKAELDAQQRRRRRRR